MGLRAAPTKGEATSMVKGKIEKRAPRKRPAKKSRPTKAVSMDDAAKNALSRAGNAPTRRPSRPTARVAPAMSVEQTTQLLLEDRARLGDDLYAAIAPFITERGYWEPPVEALTRIIAERDKAKALAESLRPESLNNHHMVGEVRHPGLGETEKAEHWRDVLPSSPKSVGQSASQLEVTLKELESAIARVSSARGRIGTIADGLIGSVPEAEGGSVGNLSNTYGGQLGLASQLTSSLHNMLSALERQIDRLVSL
jgi:uncharacterized protein YukE